MASKKHWKSTALLIVCTVLVIIWILSILDYFQADEAQRAKHICKASTTKCDPNAYCYGNVTSYVCMCKFGWEGDGFVEDGYSGCQRQQLSKSRLTAYITEIILAALVILWFLVDAILTCIRLRARTRNQSQIVPAEHAYPRHEVVHGLAVEV